MTPPYDTHLPVLHAIGKVLPVRRVIEFGGGQFSTTCFLNRRFFPILKSLRTVETDESWRGRLASFLADEPRFHIQDHPPGYLTLLLADIIFVDDQQSIEERVETLEYLNGQQSATVVLPTPIVVHDYEQPAYRAALHFEHEWIFDALLPNTGIVWNGDAISKEQIEEIERLSKESL